MQGMNRMGSVAILFLMIFGSGKASCQPPASTIALVKEGKTAFRIVLPDEASRAEQKAAEIVSLQLKKASGVDIPVVAERNYQAPLPAIFLGKTAHTRQWLKETIQGEGFAYGTDGAHLYITGGSGQGVVYGAYEFLESWCAYRKYDKEPASIPVQKNVVLPKNIRIKEQPAFVFRQVFYPESNDPEYLQTHHLHKFEDLWGLWGHSFFKILPPAQYFKSHPEYYALVNGKRQPSQLCLSNEEVVRATIAFLKPAIARNPDALYWSVSQEDGGVFCQCDRCKNVYEEEKSIAGSLIRFLNNIAAAFPEQQFTTLAYGPTAKAPGRTKPAKNVFALLSNIEIYREKPVKESPSAAPFRKDLEGWAALTKNIFIWDYTTQFTNYLSPFPDYHTLADNIRYYRDKGIQGIFSQGSGDTYGDVSEWNSYLQSALLWNPDLDETALFNEFTEGYYGKAAPYVKQYFREMVAAVVATNARLDIYGNPVASAKDFLSPVYMDRFSTILDSAETAAASDEESLQRIQRLRLFTEYAALEQSKFYGMEKHGYLVPGEDAGRYVPHPRWRSRINNFVATAKKAVVIEISEGGPSPDAYALSWETLLGRQWIKNLALHAPVQLEYPYTPEYTLKKEATLTDGLSGTNDFSFNWLFTYGNDVIATIDLGKETAFSEVRMNFLSDARHYIFLPASITVETSEDGRNYVLAGEKNIPAMEENYGVETVPFYFRMPGKKARYVRVKAKNIGSIPEWRMAPGNKKPAICVDEVWVVE